MSGQNPARPRSLVKKALSGLAALVTIAPPSDPEHDSNWLLLMSEQDPRLASHLRQESPLAGRVAPQEPGRPD